MPYIFILFFLSISIFSPKAVQANQTHYISLGRDCQAAEYLRSFNLRKASFPMDWIVSGNFEKVLLAFEEEFTFFLDPEFLLYRKGYGYIENTRYDFLYNHFFPIQNWILLPNWYEYLPAVQETQGRRIDRLQSLLNSQDNLVFVRTHISPPEADRFVKLIKQKYPTLKFVLVVVHEKLEFIGEWEIPRVINFYASDRANVVDWWTRGEWARIFKELEIHLHTMFSLQQDEL